VVQAVQAVQAVQDVLVGCPVTTAAKQILGIIPQILPLIWMMRFQLLTKNAPVMAYITCSLNTCHSTDD
jgi:hypothetical protein